MKKKYDFSKGEQGKFYHPDVVLKLPIYLDDDLVGFIEEYAKEKKRTCKPLLMIFCVTTKKCFRR